MRNIFLLFVLGLLISGDSFTSRVDAEETHQIRIATLAPRQSSLGDIYQTFKIGMKKATNGAVNVKMYYGGIAGDEITVVRKMRVGQLDGALITSTGLSALVRQVLVMEAPGLIRSYPELDAVREDLAPQFEALFEKAGYKLVAWGDAGKTRIFSTSKIFGPSDLQNVRPWVWKDSATMRAFIKAAGANGVLLNLPEVYSGLQTGIIDTIIASSVGVLAFQWHTKLKTMAKQAGGIVTGAFVIRLDHLATLPQEARDYLDEVSGETEDRLRVEGRKIDDEAAVMLSKKLKVINLFRAQRQWEEVQFTARESLVGRMYSRALLSRVQEILGK
ncbi:MAG: TRAP transporter substrate-binding protein DctP [Deltaproteobacteria bacterium]|nr:TRAP transporter substrate-binding protein DctP [Deltaproteobacteria bacterium]MBW1875735.1 TRAP transporter substrate-binding protein DctP [Deltaproteobacteria bacterium]MBW2626263.1 TRAP transporter substrate-binding protein DctP [Deltaproteobacteria bacterium]